MHREIRSEVWPCTKRCYQCADLDSEEARLWSTVMNYGGEKGQCIKLDKLSELTHAVALSYMSSTWKTRSWGSQQMTIDWVEIETLSLTHSLTHSLSLSLSLSLSSELMVNRNPFRFSGFSPYVHFQKIRTSDKKEVIIFLRKKCWVYPKPNQRKSPSDEYSIQSRIFSRLLYFIV